MEKMGNTRADKVRAGWRWLQSAKTIRDLQANTKQVDSGRDTLHCQTMKCDISGYQMYFQLLQVYKSRLYHFSVIFMYCRPISIYSATYDRVISVVYSVITPTLNPFIYTLRNKEVKIAVEKRQIFPDYMQWTADFHEVRHLMAKTLELLFWELGQTGNMLILMLISSQSQLHTPMYFLLGNLSFVDICLTSITVPRAIFSLISQDLSISFHGCFIQLFLFHMVGNMDSFLLAIMALDRYAAICQPLHYTTIMSRRTCSRLLTSSWIIVSLHSTLFTAMTSTLPYCSWVIHHYFCDVPAMLLLSCTDTSAQQMVVFIEGSLIVMGPMLFILGSYVLIIRAVLKLSTAKGRRRTFSTCSSHLTVVIFFYSSVIFMYFRPSSLYSATYDRVISVVYSIITPMLNPFIYTLRNKEVKNAIKKVMQFGRTDGQKRMKEHEV
ncbi:olfactory receptor 1L4-like [Dendropsophus ebraccatus]|uniref:olfactory receptor 1L4-like n=1 Tax=Dendropsophus ebraccatus TaxID=150705 RepID=UPI003831E3AB